MKKMDPVALYISTSYAIPLDNSDRSGGIFGYKEVQKRLHNLLNAFPDINFQINTALSDSDGVAINWLVLATYLCNLASFPPAG